jgi:hypothetical protein
MRGSNTSPDSSNRKYGSLPSVPKSQKASVLRLMDRTVESLTFRSSRRVI